MNLMFQPFMRYADFHGRARRSEYWLWFLLQIIASIVFSVLQTFVDRGSELGPAKIAETIFNLAVIIPSLAVAVRRFHDIGRTGWWILFPVAVMIIALIVFFSMNGDWLTQNADGFKSMSDNPENVMANLAVLQPILLWIGLPYILAAVVTFVFHVTDGTPGNNRFGADPKGRGSSVTANVF